MGVFDRYKSELAEQAHQQAAAAEAIRKANKARSDDLARQAREAAVINLKQVAEFLPLFKALNARNELQDLVRLWGMGRVDEIPQYIPEGNYASLAWRKRHWNHEQVGINRASGGDELDSTIYGNVVRSVLFAVEVRRDPAISFRTSSEEHGRIFAPGWNKASDWHEFSLDDSSSARTLLIDVMYQKTKDIMHPLEIIKAGRHYINGGFESPSGYVTPETPIRHPFLLRLGIPDFDLPERR